VDGSPAPADGSVAEAPAVEAAGSPTEERDPSIPDVPEPLFYVPPLMEGVPVLGLDTEPGTAGGPEAGAPDGSELAGASVQTPENLKALDEILGNDFLAEGQVPVATGLADGGAPLDFSSRGSEAADGAPPPPPGSPPPPPGAPTSSVEFNAASETVAAAGEAVPPPPPPPLLPPLPDSADAPSASSVEFDAASETVAAAAGSEAVPPPPPPPAGQLPPPPPPAGGPAAANVNFDAAMETNAAAAAAAEAAAASERELAPPPPSDGEPPPPPDGTQGPTSDFAASAAIVNEILSVTPATEEKATGAPASPTLTGDTGTSSGTPLPSGEGDQGDQDAATDEPVNLLMGQDFFTRSTERPRRFKFKK